MEGWKGMLILNPLCALEGLMPMRVVPSDSVTDHVLHRHRMTPLIFPNQSTDILPVESWKLLTSLYILFRVIYQIQGNMKRTPLWSLFETRLISFKNVFLLEVYKSGSPTNSKSKHDIFWKDIPNMPKGIYKSLGFVPHEKSPSFSVPRIILFLLLLH